MKLQYLASTLSVIALIASSGCGSVYAVTFTPPDKNDAPSQATGGASRGGNLFTPSQDNSSPQQATGGASRGNLFTPSQGNSSPQQATGGAARGNLFTPSQGNSSPQQASGGAARGNLFTPNPSNSSPQQASGGAARTGTYYVNPVAGEIGPAALIALLPQSFYGTTVSERPTIMVYLPISNAKEAIFSIKDDVGKTYYSMKINVALKAGVIPIQLPVEAPALAIGKNYHWFLAVKVNGNLSPSTPYVDGWIKRIQPTSDLANAMKQTDTLKLITALGKDGVWYDCVAKLGTLHASKPQDTALSKQWEELLSSVNLNTLVKSPLIASKN
jgi:hypothetical protein